MELSDKRFTQATSGLVALLAFVASEREPVPQSKSDKKGERTEQRIADNGGKDGVAGQLGARAICFLLDASRSYSTWSLGAAAGAGAVAGGVIAAVTASVAPRPLNRDTVN